MPAYTGRDVLIEFAIANEDANPGTLTWSTLGMLRGKGLSLTWDTIDATADMSPEYTKETLVSFKSVEFSFDGVARTEAIHNQAELKAHVYNPGPATNNQPKAWLRQTAPDGVTQGPFILTSFENDQPYSDVVTFSAKAMSNGAINFTPA